MELKDLIDTLIAHQIIDLAFRLQLLDINRRQQADAKGQYSTQTLEGFLPEAAKRYAEIRAAITAIAPS